MNDLTQSIKSIEKYIENPKKGLPDDIFYLMSRLTPLINVDLIVYSSSKEIIFTWRDDEDAGQGWHLPGGIIRYKENMIDRVKLVAQQEMGIELSNIKGPVDIKQIIDKTKSNRAHFISLLFKCYIDVENEKIISNKTRRDPKNFLLAKGVPKNLLSWHRIYEEYF